MPHGLELVYPGVYFVKSISIFDTLDKTKKFREIYSLILEYIRENIWNFENSEINEWSSVTPHWGSLALAPPNE